jgi:hypothetical protein
VPLSTAAGPSRWRLTLSATASCPGEKRRNRPFGVHREARKRGRGQRPAN